ncbi:tyrosine-protein phosphatase, partial [Lactiplantibacillus pentosus]
TNEARAAANQQILQQYAAQMSPDQQRAVNEALVVDEDYLTHYFEVVQEHYGTFDAYLYTGLGLTAAELQRLRQLYLTD